jgi:hypothetical protein
MFFNLCVLGVLARDMMTLRLECEIKCVRGMVFSAFGVATIAHYAPPAPTFPLPFWIKLMDGPGQNQPIRVMYGYTDKTGFQAEFETGLSASASEWHTVALEADESNVRYYFDQQLLAIVSRALIGPNVDLWGGVLLIRHGAWWTGGDDFTAHALVDRYKAFNEGQQTDGCDFEGPAGGFNALPKGWSGGGSGALEDEAHGNVMRLSFGGAYRSPFVPGRLQIYADRFGTRYAVTSPANNAASLVAAQNGIRIFRHEGQGIGALLKVIKDREEYINATLAIRPDSRMWLFVYLTTPPRLYHFFSHDDGETWGGPSEWTFTNMAWNVFPEIQAARDGTIILVWAEGNKVMMQRVGESKKNIFTLADPTARPSISFRIDPDDRWWIFFVYGSDNGDLSTAGWKVSTDNGESWSDG